MTKLIKILAILTLLIFMTGCEEKPIGKITKDTYNLKSEMDPRLKAYPEAVEWYEDSDSYPEAAFSLGYFYQNTLKDYKESIIWYKRAYEKGYVKAANNMASVYIKLKDYNNAKKWYDIAISQNVIDAYFNVALLYDTIIKDKKKAIEYYILAIERESSSISSLKNIALLYIEIKDNIKASAYLLTLIEYPNYTKEEVLNYLKNDLKIDDETIKKGYELQLTMPGLPRRYKGDLNLD